MMNGVVLLLLMMLMVLMMLMMLMVLMVLTVLLVLMVVYPNTCFVWKSVSRTFILKLNV